ncbi:MAG: (Fe-S)-binding protein [Candidatus Brocadia sp. AMX2]|nr:MULTISPECIES: (Fe-S)-binding protein [Brocadia]KXK29719.1 MAG: putative iron sulfur protein [Candidatus Brocadia sinica]MBC6931813.1 (Fe-S)-binding protein [Candidatus Brocadia sp.]MBL1167332.1 (Fe-S)-binding protein [Candidatus Brocadia sp. AMX1]NOG41194.1 (Fe-S)-binding protein [Planctomycetota bacterium]KAA0245734.1 MAG: (Fe-S)-binding protein [Candidatus Brocadia sp. AMX2]
MFTKEYETEINKCAKCGKCRSVCPVFIETGNESMVARGRISLADALRNGEIFHTELLRDYLLSCKKCLRCSSICPSGVNYDFIIQTMLDDLANHLGIWFIPRIVFKLFLTRRWLFNLLLKTASTFQRLVPLKRHGTMRHLPFMFMGGRWIPPLAKETVLKKYRNAKKIKSPKMKVGFYVGCLINYVYTDIADAVIEVLNHFGAAVIIPTEQLCCGIPARSLGDVKTARRLAEVNVEVFEKANVDFIITACATCGRTLKRDYPHILGNRALKFTDKLYDISEFIEKYFTYETKTLNTKITYHDPCHLYWGQNISKQPRDILRHSADFQEMENPERCCGGGGVFNLLHYDLSMKIGEHKARAIEKCGAKVVATGCPGCRLQIEDLLAARGSEVKCTHTIQVLRDAMLR